MIIQFMESSATHRNIPDTTFPDRSGTDFSTVEISDIRERAANRANASLDGSKEKWRSENLRKNGFLPVADAEGIRAWFSLDPEVRYDRLVRAKNWSAEWAALSGEWNREHAEESGFRIPESHSGAARILGCPYDKASFLNAVRGFDASRPETFEADKRRYATEAQFFEWYRSG